MTTYYIVLVNGVPMDVTTIWSRAVKSQQELSTSTKDAIILPCVPAQEEFDFMSEGPTEKDIEQLDRSDL